MEKMAGGKRYSCGKGNSTMKCPVCLTAMNFDEKGQEWICPGEENESHLSVEATPAGESMKTAKVIEFSAPKTYETEEIEAIMTGKVNGIATPAAMQLYKGGKNQDGVYQRIINQIPPHDIWVECCAGSAAITKRIAAAKESYCIEIDEDQAIRLAGDVQSSVLVSNGNFMELLPLEELAAGDYFLFIDPPYLMTTRTNKQPIYKNEWNEEDHIAFLLWVQQVRCKVLITHPKDQLYSDALGDWRTLDYKYMTHKGERSDRIWMNYPVPKALHDYQFLGDSRTERQQISRLSKRWTARFMKNSKLVQGKILTSLEKQFSIDNK